MSSEEAEWEAALSPLSWLFGVWESVEADAAYPTMEPVKYKEVMEFKPILQCLPYVDYKSETWHAVKKSRLHSEKGLLKVEPESGKAAFLVTHHFGLTEVSEGTVTDTELLLESKDLGHVSFSDVTATVKIIRKIFLEGEELRSNVLMQTANQPLQNHLQCRYRKKK